MPNTAHPPYLKKIAGQKAVGFRVFKHLRSILLYMLLAVFNFFTPFLSNFKEYLLS
jgi:hypothetical protein